MKIFLYKLFLFFSGILVAYIAIIALISHIFNTNYLYKIPPAKTTLVIGSSLTTVSINDSLLENVFNFSQFGDAFEFSYVKLRKMLAVNKNIHVVLMSCSNVEISKMNETERLQVWLTPKIKSYYFLLSPEEILYALTKKPEQIIGVLASIPKGQLPGCIDILKSKATLSDFELGQYEGLDSTIKIKIEMKKQDDLLKKYSQNPGDELNISERNIYFLHKIVSLCKSSNVQLILLRTPQHRLSARRNEQVYLNLLKQQFPDVPFQDYVDTYLPDSCFFDVVHLNRKGAAIFTDSIRNFLARNSYTK